MVSLVAILCKLMDEGYYEDGKVVVKAIEKRLGYLISAHARSQVQRYVTATIPM